MKEILLVANQFKKEELMGIGLDPGLLEFLIDEHEMVALPTLERMWDYYRNDIADQSDSKSYRPYRLAQERGLPPRLIGASQSTSSQDREIVIENDIAWRVHTLVDFIFGKPFSLQSMAKDRDLGNQIEELLRGVFEANGGISFFQDIALIGSVYGYVDVLLRLESKALPSSLSAYKAQSGHHRDLLNDAKLFVLEIIEGPRAIPVLNPNDYRQYDSYIIHYRRYLNQVDSDGIMSKVRNHLFGSSFGIGSRISVECTEVWTDQQHITFQDRDITHESLNRLFRIPVVHIQNLPQPYYYEGLSEVEPLIPLQDELNTRLSDRANRVTFQSFKMYLGKGIEGFSDRPVGPGQMWSTDNPDASIQEFGGDSISPSEDAHINQIRDAMDKTSGVNAVAAGLLRDKVGNLTSENALRIVLMGLLAKTEKRRNTYGNGIERICELILHAADVYGILPNRPSDRRVRIDWPGLLPENQTQRLQDALLKLKIGVSTKQVLTELGYSECIASAE